MRPRLSVVVPFYGVQDYLGGCLESLRRQTFTDLEVVMVDDGSPDDSQAIARSYAERDARFRLVVQDNSGPGPARNNGIAHATGELLAFADGDDLVPWHALQQMVEVIDHSGSSMVAGNARRFDRARGVRPSWSHRIPFARNVTATHVFQKPDLVLDRMVWNKVYRRDFWDSAGLVFPAMQYEDYPVVLEAHIRALTVDVVSDPVYYWRERESGDSITQQTFRYSNLLDRVVSAEMIFDLVEGTSREMRRLTHAHLAEIDLTALVQAFGVVEDHDVDTMLELGDRFVSRLDPAALQQRPRFDRVQFAALRAKDVDLLRRLASFRAKGQVENSRVERNPRKPWVLESDFPGRDGTSVPRDTYRMPRSSLRLTSNVEDVSWDHRGVRVRGTAGIRHLDLDAGDDVQVTAAAGFRRIPLTITGRTVAPGPDGRDRIGFEAFLPAATIRDLPPVCWPVLFQLYVAHGTIRRKEPLRGIGGGSPVWPSGLWVDAESWVQNSTRRDGALQLTQVNKPPVVTEVVADDGAFLISGSFAHRLPEFGPDGPGRVNVTVVRQPPFRTTEIPTTVSSVDPSQFTARLELSELAGGETPKDPYTLQNWWDLRLRLGDSVVPLLWTSDYEVVEIARDGAVFSLTPTSGKFLRAWREPAKVRASDVHLEDGEVLASGTWWPPARPEVVTWRRFVAGTDDHVDVPCRLELDDERWTARCDLADLSASLVPTEDEPEPDADWTLTWTSDGGDQAVVCLPRAGSRLPLRREHDGTPWSLDMVRDTVHVGGA